MASSSWLRHLRSDLRNQGGRALLWQSLKLLLIIAVPALILLLIRDVNWHEVWSTLRNYSPWRLLGAFGLVVGSYLLYSSFDLLGRNYTRHHLATMQILPRTFVCYAFSLNFGAWLGGFALRYRLYSSVGLRSSTIAAIISISLISNWGGYLLLLGLLFAGRLLELPPDWSLGTTSLQILGFLFLSLIIAYVLACRYASQRVWQWRRVRVELPSWRLAVLQLGLGASNWLLMATVIYLLLPPKAAYTTVVGTLLASAFAGLITHIPGGLGVLEAVFVAMMGATVPRDSLLAALITYRTLYYLFPLLLACLSYLTFEKNSRRRSTAPRWRG